jgi:hypothetical protein
MPVDDEVGQDQTQVAEPTPTFDEWQSAQSTGAENSQQNASPEAPPVSAQQETQTQPPSGGHPAWDPIRQAVGDETFEKIKGHLSEFDRNAQSRITELNSKYDPWGQFEKQGVNPDIVTRALGIVRGIDENPLQMYQLLENHLRQQGLLQEPGQVDPSQQDPEAEVDPRDLELQALREQQEQIQQFLQAQQVQAQQEQMNRQADTALDQEIQSFRQAHEGISKEDEGVILREYARRLKAGEYDTDLESIYAEREAFRTQILSQPRPNDFAPRIPGSGGTAPTAANHQQKEVADYSREESQALLAERLRLAINGG